MSRAIGGADVIDQQAQRLLKALRTAHGAVASMDLDGVLTWAVCSGVSCWSLDGLFDSRNLLWLSDDLTTGRLKPVFLDVHVARADVLSVDQHIVAATTRQGSVLRESQNKINPNLARMTTLHGEHGHSFTSKYPFGTVHYVIALLERLGIRITLDVDRPIAPGLTVIDLLMRADGAAENTARYAANASNWWSWLVTIGGDMTRLLATTALEIAASPPGFSVKKQALTREFGAIGCSSSDGNFASATLRDGGTPRRVLQTFWRWLGLDGHPRVPDLHLFRGDHQRVHPDSRESDVLLQHAHLFSYAYTSTRVGGLSVTLLDLAAEAPLLWGGVVKREGE